MWKDVDRGIFERIAMELLKRFFKKEMKQCSDERPMEFPKNLLKEYPEKLSME